MMFYNAMLPVQREILFDVFGLALAPADLVNEFLRVGGSPWLVDTVTPEGYTVII